MKTLLENHISEHLDASVSTDGGALKATLSLNIGALLDQGAVKVKAAIPGEIEGPFVDAIVAALKKAIGLDPVAAVEAAAGGEVGPDPKAPQ